MHLAENLVTTMSPSAIWYSKVTSAKERAAWNSVTDRLYSSRLEPWPGSKLRSVKVGASSSSIVSSSLLTKASRKRRAKALFFSSSEVTEDSLLLDDSRFSAASTPCMMPASGVRRIDWRFIHRSAWKGYSPKFRIDLVLFGRSSYVEYGKCVAQ